jgi:probable F420-dependent oxidoreductase
MGPQSTPETLLACALAAESAGLSDLWVQDHLAIPPDDAEGSGGRYLDPLTALAWIAAKTSRIGVATGVINLPYRPPLPTAKAVATVQELSGGRLLLGVGVGWMEAEFRALGVPRSERGRRMDEALAFLHEAFSRDTIQANGQDFLFLPRPERPPIYVGGQGEHALRRAARFGDAWFPMVSDPKQLAAGGRRLAEFAAESGRPVPTIATFARFDANRPGRAMEQVEALLEVGVTHIVAGVRYDDAEAFDEEMAFLAEQVLPATD